MLVDFASWAKRRNRDYSSFRKDPITIDEVKSIIKEQGLSIKKGDILFLRTGYAQAYQQLSQEDRAAVAGVKEWIGLGQGQETTEWLWNSQFAAVASDSPGFECRRKSSPAPLTFYKQSSLTSFKAPVDPAWHLHPILLAGWGTPIGELFDLDKLAELCNKYNRWSFFVTSAPLNYEGAVASPPNAMAIF